MKSFMIASLRILGGERTKLLTNCKISVPTSPNGLPRPINLELVIFFNFHYFSVLSIHLELVLLFIVTGRPAFRFKINIVQVPPKLLK